MDMVETAVCGTQLMLPAARHEHHTVNPAWEGCRLQSMRANLRPGWTVYDVGAEEGDLSALYAMWVRHGPEVADPPPYTGGVLLVEPSPWYWPRMRETFEANDLQPVAGFHGFCADVPNHIEAAAYLPWGEPWPSAAKDRTTNRVGFANVTERPDLACATIDMLAARWEPPSAISIDVEGAELRVLRGAEQVLEQCRPVVWVSTHPESMILGYDDREGDLIGYMSGLSYDFLHLGWEHEHHWVFWPDGYDLQS